MGSAIIGDNCNIGQNVFIADGVKIGNNNKVQNNVSIYTGVECEDDVFMGPSMVFTNVINPRSAVIRKEEYKRTLIKKGASIGANATIICGNEIGHYAMIGAGAVVTKNVKDFELLVGNPARQIGWVSERGNKLQFDENGIALCKETSSKYLLEDGKVIKVN
jgi:UDP-2-acetamido-3-amino-2,3-dideoxy-glucuronate N-acetyltransferase